MSPTLSTSALDIAEPLLKVVHNVLDQAAVRDDDEGDERDDDEDDGCVGGCLTKWMIIFGALLVIEGLFFAHLIYGLKSLRKFTRFASVSPSTIKSLKHYGNAFSAGIFFSTGVIHLLPEVIELFESEEDEEGEAEEAAEAAEVESATRTGGSMGTLVRTGGGSGGFTFPFAYFTVVAAFYAMFAVERLIIPMLIGSRACAVEVEPIVGVSSDEAEMLRSASDEEISANEKKGLDDSEEEVVDEGVSSAAFTKGLIHVIALSVHALFESMAIGLSVRFTSMLNIFIALAAHRWATSISIAFNLAWSLNYVPFLLLFMVFIITTPIGIGIGAALTGLDDTVQGVFFAISAATFIYIGAFSAMSQEFVEHPTNVVKKYWVMVSGFAVISFITWGLVAGDVHP